MEAKAFIQERNSRKNMILIIGDNEYGMYPIDNIETSEKSLEMMFSDAKDYNIDHIKIDNTYWNNPRSLHIYLNLKNII